MTVHTVLVLVLSALCLGGALATEEEVCNPVMEKCAAVSGEALLQKNFKQSRLWSADLDVEPRDDRQTQPSDMSLLEMAETLASSSRRHGLQSGYQGSPHCVSSDVESSQMQNQLLLLTTGVKVVSGRQAGGMDAPLNSEGFRDTTAMCCPVEMEMFFNRLLDSLGLDVCSKPHVQGLMHWFTCVPKMDFQYVLDVIANGNPCKYWAPKGEVCPTLVGSCAGQWCGHTTTAGPASTATTSSAETTTTTTTTTTTMSITTTTGTTITFVTSTAPIDEEVLATTTTSTTATTNSATTTTSTTSTTTSTTTTTTTSTATTTSTTATTSTATTTTTTSSSTTTSTTTTTTTTSTTPTTIPTTTTTPSGCAPQMDVVMAIDASKSVKSEGWDAEVEFAQSLIVELTAGGNPNGQRINLHYFNKGTMPIGAPGGANSEGAFSTDPQSMLDALSSLDYATIRVGGTDHPQAYMTAAAALGSPSYETKVLVLITDGLTHSGAGCKGLDQDTVEKKIGKCSKQSSHVCASMGCDLVKCMCGVYNAALFKEAGYKLIIAGVPNKNHVSETEAGTFSKIMEECASPGEFYRADNFEDLPSIVAPLTDNLCQ